MRHKNEGRYRGREGKTLGGHVFIVQTAVGDEAYTFIVFRHRIKLGGKKNNEKKTEE